MLFGVTVLSYFIKILGGSRNYLRHCYDTFTTIWKPGFRWLCSLTPFYKSFHWAEYDPFQFRSFQKQAAASCLQKPLRCPCFPAVKYSENLLKLILAIYHSTKSMTISFTNSCVNLTLVYTLFCVNNISVIITQNLCKQIWWLHTICVSLDR